LFFPGMVMFATATILSLRWVLTIVNGWQEAFTEAGLAVSKLALTGI
jgi:hypothetical protein